MTLFQAYLAISELCAMRMMQHWWGRLILWDVCENTEFKFIAERHGQRKEKLWNGK